jgi:hypothetical protein
MFATAPKMMRLKLLCSRCGHVMRAGQPVTFSQYTGQIIDVPENEGERMIEAGQAVAVETTKSK